jgi:lipopolysaccharide/colanic/teichoic acid biosynthesis glycosyltransferase
MFSTPTPALSTPLASRVSADVVHPARRMPQRAIKRTVDVVIATVAVVICSPLFLLAAMIVRVSSTGPILYRHTCFGLALRPFTMFKFRTMVADAEQRRGEVSQLNEAKGVFKIRRDPRLTRFGSFLRRTSLDELPQLFNVIRGDMSLVGPRPLPPWIVEEMADDQFCRRYIVLPGMTGLWQIHGGGQDSDAMIKDDLTYLEDWSPLEDLRILAATVPALIRHQGV